MATDIDETKGYNNQKQTSPSHTVSASALVAIGTIGAAVATTFASPILVGVGLATGAVGAGLQIKDAIDAAKSR